MDAPNGVAQMYCAITPCKLPRIKIKEVAPMDKKLTFAMRKANPAPVVNARNPYLWTDCGSVIVPFDATDEQVEQAKRNSCIPSDALCVRAELI